MRLVVIGGISGEFLIDLCHALDYQWKLLARQYAAAGWNRKISSMWEVLDVDVIPVQPLGTDRFLFTTLLL